MPAVAQGTVSITLQISQANLAYQSRPNAFQFVPAGSNGPTPGAITITAAGTDILLLQLTAMGGMVWAQNMDATNYVTLGVRDKVTNVFYPFCELLPGEFYCFRSSRKIPKEEVGTGTFTGTNVVYHAKANAANVILRFDAFDP
jgi:hypothetical protein